MCGFNLWELLVIELSLIFAVPMTVFMSIKMGVFAYHVGKANALKYLKKDEQDEYDRQEKA